MRKLKLGLFIAGTLLGLSGALAQDKPAEQKPAEAASDKDDGWHIRAVSAVYAIASLTDKDTTVEQDFAAASAADILQDSYIATALYRRAAYRGNVYAQVMSGLRAANVLPEEALKYFRMAAEKGDPFGQMGVGSMYEIGRGGVKQDNVEARKLFMQAAEKGEKKAIFAIAESYYGGRFGYDESKRNVPEASEWLQRAAELKDMGSINAIIEGYKVGRYGLKVDADKQAEWEAKRNEILGIKEVKKKKIRR